MKIETKDYYWDCGEPGCCSEYGTILYLDGVEVSDHNFSDRAAAYLYILEELQGHEVDYIYEEQDDE